METWTEDPEELAALDALRATFSVAADALHTIVEDAGETPPAGGHVPTP